MILKKIGEYYSIALLSKWTIRVFHNVLRVFFIIFQHVVSSFYGFEHDAQLFKGNFPRVLAKPLIASPKVLRQKVDT